ncbi:MAG: hypothetical protein CM15mP10_0550 [Actinomycetota bacterium]|nr:MAG: hypothetical protein CM15mP10_0550 [Actinomycetota bacterium]
MSYDFSYYFLDLLLKETVGVNISLEDIFSLINGKLDETSKILIPSIDGGVFRSIEDPPSFCKM